MAKLLFFGRLGELADDQNRTALIHSKGQSVKSILTALHTSNPDLGEALRNSRTRVMVNGEFVAKDAIINDNDEIAFLPPVSGG